MQFLYILANWDYLPQNFIRTFRDNNPSYSMVEMSTEFKCGKEHHLQNSQSHMLIYHGRLIHNDCYTEWHFKGTAL